MPPRRVLIPALLLILALLALAALSTPADRTLGASIRLVYFHGAWVWAGITVYALAGATGLAALALPGGLARFARLSLLLGRVGLFYWLTYLPLSLLVMRLFWGGFFFAEPRWRIPLAFAVVSVLLQVGLAVLDDPRFTCLGNLLFGAALLWQLLPAGSVLHPQSPVFGSGSLRIELSFIALLALSLLFAGGLVLAFWKSRP